MDPESAKLILDEISKLSGRIDKLFDSLDAKIGERLASPSTPSPSFFGAASVPASSTSPLGLSSTDEPVSVFDSASFDLDPAVSNTISIEHVSSDSTKRSVDRPLAASEALAEQVPEERFAEEVNLYDFPCDGNDQAPPHRVTTTATSSPATSTSPSATSPASSTLASVALTPASSAAASFAEMRHEVDQQQIPAASWRRPRPATPSSSRSAPPLSPRTSSPQRRSVLDAEDHAASRLRAVAEENRALKQALARREGELQLVQMKYADEACVLTVVQGQLKELTEDTVPRNMPDRCLMNCLILSQSCFSPPFSYSWDAVIGWQHRP